MKDVLFKHGNCRYHEAPIDQNGCMDDDIDET